MYHFPFVSFVFFASLIVGAMFLYAHFSKPTALPAATSESERVNLYDANKKSMGVIFAVWFFFGWCGAHRIMLRRIGSGVAMMILALLAFFTLLFGFGLIIMPIIWLWWFVDLFLISGMVREYNQDIAVRLNGAAPAIA